MYKKTLIFIIIVLGLLIQICFAESVTINSSLGDKDGNTLILPAILKKPNGKGLFPAVVLLAGCSGEWFNSIRETTWADLLVSWGYVTIQPDTWTPASTCTELMPSGKTEHEVIHHIYPDAYHDFDWPGLDETYEGQKLVYNASAA